MPKKVGAGGHTPIRQPQEPPPPTSAAAAVAAQPSSSSSSSAGPSRKNAGGASSQRLTKAQRNADLGKADEKNLEFNGYAKQLHLLEEKFSTLLKNAREQLQQDVVLSLHQAPAVAGPAAARARGEEREKEKGVIKKYHKALAVLKAPLDGPGSKCLVDQFYGKLDEFDAKSERTRYGIVHAKLDDTVAHAKKALAGLVHDRESAHSIIAEIKNGDLRGRHDQLMREFVDLSRTIQREGEGGEAFRRLTPLMALFARLNVEMGDLRADGLARMEVATGMLSRSEVQHSGVLKKDFISLHQAANYSNAGLSLLMTESVMATIQILLGRAVAGGSTEQKRNDLTAWADGVAEMFKEFHLLTAVNLDLMAKEKSVLRSEYHPTAEEERVWTAAAADIPERYGQISATLRGCADRYDSLRPAVDHNLGALIREMATCVDDAKSSRLQAAQSGAERVRATEAERLPAHMLPRQHQPEPGPQLLRTRDGVVLGLVNEQGKLDAVGPNKNVAASYFRDEGEWVRDYGDEVKVAPGARPTTKANNIAAASDRSVARLREQLQGVTDTEQIGLLQRAYASKARAMVQIAGTLPDANPTEAATLKNLLTGLAAGKKALWLEVQQARDILMMRHDPNPAAFRQLWDSGRVASIEQTKQRQPNRNDALDLLDRYVISFKDVPGKAPFKPWVVHAHYDAVEKNAKPQLVHMKRFDEKDWGRDSGAYHSAPLNPETFAVIRGEIVRQMVEKMRMAQA